MIATAQLSKWKTIFYISSFLFSLSLILPAHSYLEESGGRCSMKMTFYVLRPVKTSFPLELCENAEVARQMEQAEVENQQYFKNKFPDIPLYGINQINTIHFSLLMLPMGYAYNGLRKKRPWSLYVGGAGVILMNFIIMYMVAGRPEIAFYTLMLAGLLILFSAHQLDIQNHLKGHK